MRRSLLRRLALGPVAVLILLGMGACGGGGGGFVPEPPPGGEPPPSPPPPLTIGPYDSLPGVVLTAVDTSGGTGPGGNFRPGDVVTVQFTLKTDAGEPLDLTLMNSGSIYLAGPSTNYNRVIPPQSDLRARAAYLGDATWRYTFAVPIPEVYGAPVNDSPSFGAPEGELSGQPLLDGTYTIGIETTALYTVEDESKRDAGSLTVDVLLGSATSIVHHEVVTDAHCNQCHTDLRAHGGRRTSVRLCVLCHTSGAEDRNGSIEGGTPGVSVDFRVMIHKIHNGKHLPSVLGVGTNPNGTRDYALTPQPYKVVGFGTLDASEIGFPVMPSAYVAYLFDASGTTYTGTGGNGPMPRDVGYGALTPSRKLQEDQIRTGVVSCQTCHGDPDGAGPIAAPAQGDLHEAQPSRKACGSCHDDVDWSRPYAANGDVMIANPDPSACVQCHPAASTGAGLYPVRQSHLHPYSNPAVNTGVNVVVTGIGGGTGPGGNHQVGDRISATFTVKDDAGSDIQIQKLTRFQAIATGPTTNPQFLAGNATLFDNAFRKSSPFTGTGSVTALSVGTDAVEQVLAIAFTAPNTFDVIGSVSGPLAVGQVVTQGGSLPVSVAGVSFTVNDTGTDFAAGDRLYFEVVPTAASYTRFVPVDLSFERIGSATGSAQDLAVANLPLHWGRHTVFERTALVGSSAPIASASASLVRFLVADASVLSGLAVGDRVVVDDGSSAEEYLQVGRIQTSDDLTGADLGALDRIWFTTAVRFAHDVGDSLQEVTLTSKREGIAFAVADAAAGQLTLFAGQFTVGNPVVVSYRTDVRFGRWRAPGDALQAVYPDVPADSEDIDASWGDWKGLPFLDGTYTVGFYVNRDFTVNGNVPTIPNGEATTYRMISPPAKGAFLFGDETTIALREIVDDGAACDRCHGDLQFHGNGRRGLETCLNCHATPGVEDGPKYSFSSWYTGPTPGVAMEFRNLLHKIHMGKELPNASTYEAIGVFLGVPYVAKVDDKGFPAMPGGVMQCVKCHGEGNDAWREPAPRAHPDALVPVRTWRSVCGSCHDSDAAHAHIDAQTSAGGYESCAVCHGPGRDVDVVKAHVPR